jgi:hypothetical protein
VPSFSQSHPAGVHLQHNVSFISLSRSQCRSKIPTVGGLVSLLLHPSKVSLLLEVLVVYHPFFYLSSIAPAEKKPPKT